MVTSSVTIPEFGHSYQCIKACVLRQSVGDHLQSLDSKTTFGEGAVQMGIQKRDLARTSAYALMHSLSIPETVFAYCASFCDTSASAAAPPAIMYLLAMFTICLIQRRSNIQLPWPRYLFFTSDRMTHSASCNDLSASPSVCVAAASPQFVRECDII